METFPELPRILAEKAAAFPESTFGAVPATLMLRDGTRVSDVILAWGSQIIRVANRPVLSEADLGFDLGEVVDVTPP